MLATLNNDYWIPPEALPAFNDAIVGEIEVVAELGATEGG
jgi:hypothetical protein